MQCAHLQNWNNCWWCNTSVASFRFQYQCHTMIHISCSRVEQILMRKKKKKNRVRHFVFDIKIITTVCGSKCKYGLRNSNYLYGNYFSKQITVLVTLTVFINTYGLIVICAEMRFAHRCMLHANEEYFACLLFHWAWGFFFFLSFQQLLKNRSRLEVIKLIRSQ